MVQRDETLDRTHARCRTVREVLARLGGTARSSRYDRSTGDLWEEWSFPRGVMVLRACPFGWDLYAPLAQEHELERAIRKAVG